MSDERPHTDAPLAPSTPVSVVVVNYEGVGHLEETLPSLAALEGEITEVIFVDNASTDDSVRLARELLPSVTVLEMSENLGPAAARHSEADRDGCPPPLPRHRHPHAWPGRKTDASLVQG